MAMGCIGMLQSMDHHRSNSFLLAVTWHGSRAVGLTRHWNHEVLDTEALVCATAHLSEWRARRRGRPNKFSCWRRRQHNCLGVDSMQDGGWWEVFWRFYCLVPNVPVPKLTGLEHLVRWEAGEKGCVAIERVCFEQSDLSGSH
jgi:predicted transposase YbfD/YdcC